MQRQVSFAFEGINTETPANGLLCAKYTKSFAYYTVKDRLPVILTKVINELSVCKGNLIEKYGEGTEDDLKSVIGQISKLKNELVTNKSFIGINSLSDDAEDWNNYIESQINSSNGSPCWYYSPWLFVENYLYRRLWAIFENSTKLQEFDPFSKQKEESFDSELKEVGKMALETLKCIPSSHQNKKDIVINFLKLSLWSNTYDGSLMTECNCNMNDINELDSHLLKNDSERVFEYLTEHSNGLLDFVNDNSLYEVFFDLCLCDILCSFSLVSKVRFHVKRIPWYVTDTMKKDINCLLNKLEKEGLKELSDRWRKYFQDSTWSVFDEKYWTLPFDYNEMKSRDPNLYNTLSKSDLVIFKGDLNYRKLLGDINWDFCEKFEVALREFKPTSVLSLRSVKADLICDVSQEKIDSLGEDKMWMRTGDYATIQFYCHR